MAQDSMTQDVAPTRKPGISPEWQKKVREETRATPEGRELRKETARNIWEERGALREVREKIQELQPKVASKHAAMETPAQMKAEAPSPEVANTPDLQKRKTSLLGRTREFFRRNPQLLQEQQEIPQEQIKTLSNIDIERLQKEYDQLTRELHELTQQEESMPDWKETLRKFESEQAHNLYTQEKLDDLERFKAKNGTVEAVVREHNEYFVHATAPNIRRGQNNPFLREGVTWDDKVASLVVNNHTISGSSVSYNGPGGMWNRIGVVLCGGNIERASVDDRKTKVATFGEREGGFVPQSIEDYQRHIQRALSHANSYNEYSISEPKIAGLYIKPNTSSQRTMSFFDWHRETAVRIKSDVIVSYREIFDVAGKFGMPVLAFDGNVAYAVTLNEETGTLIKGDEVTPQQMLDIGYEIPEENREAIREQAQRALSPETLVA